MTRDIVLGIEVHAEPKAVFDTVATRSGLASFWTSDVEGDEQEGGELTFGFAQAPARLPMRVTTLDAPDRDRVEHDALVAVLGRHRPSRGRSSRASTARR